MRSLVLLAIMLLLTAFLGVGEARQRGKGEKVQSIMYTRMVMYLSGCDFTAAADADSLGERYALRARPFTTRR